MDGAWGAVMALAAAFGAFVASAVLPWLNAEVLLLSMMPLVRSWNEAALLVLVATAGQISGKVAIYWLARAAGRGDVGRGHGRDRYALDRWRARMTRRPASAVSLLFVSAAVGVPPFFVLSVLAGLLRVRFDAFVAAGTLGRLVHFGVIAGLAGLGSGLYF